VLCKNRQTDQDAILQADSRNRVLDGVEIPPWEGTVLGVIWLTKKHWESLVLYMQLINPQ